jgi:hypothetical protein
MLMTLRLLSQDFLEVIFGVLTWTMRANARSLSTIYRFVGLHIFNPPFHILLSQLYVQRLKQLDVKGCADIYESLRRYTAKELLEGENQYDAGDFGKRNAEKGVIFTKLPPVLTVHLKRFDFSVDRMVRFIFAT